MSIEDEEVRQKTSISDVFLELNQNQDVRIIDVACGIGIVAEDLRKHGYTNIDGLDPSKGYLEVAMSKGLYKNVYACSVDPKQKTPIEDNTYDILLCCAGFFQGLISPLGFQELIRITKPGGILIWNIAYGYEHFGKDFEKYDQIISGLVADKKWSFLCPVRKFKQMVFTDCGAAFLKGYEGAGVIDSGMVYLMRKC